MQLLDKGLRLATPDYSSKNSASVSQGIHHIPLIIHLVKKLAIQGCPRDHYSGIDLLQHQFFASAILLKKLFLQRPVASPKIAFKQSNNIISGNRIDSSALKALSHDHLALAIALDKD